MLATVLLATALSSVPIEVGRFDVAEFPKAEKLDRRIPHAELTHRVDKILSSRKCSLPGQTKARYNISVPYAVLMQSSGNVTRVVVQEIGCAPIELLVGQVAVELSKVGGFRTSHQHGDRWYVSELYFARGGEYSTKPEENQDTVICQAAQPVLGSRLAKKKVCRTITQWKQHAEDLAQRRRDLDMQP